MIIKMHLLHIIKIVLLGVVKSPQTLSSFVHTRHHEGSKGGGSKGLILSLPNKIRQIYRRNNKKERSVISHNPFPSSSHPLLFPAGEISG
jgi:hypothetical protein